ncbi:UNVERIFIED_CONTAM: hypothetical protein HDU68_009549 [Siphonaria sp. JEL0065]|nr:hypothetical protein HDU68_009549 [Siphonaria sp. JEL0065]
MITSLPVVIQGDGGSLPLQPYVSALADFSNLYSGVIANPYSSTDSTAGQVSVKAGTLNWAGTDFAIYPAYSNNGSLVALPAIAGANIIAYNLPGITLKVKFSAKFFPEFLMGQCVITMTGSVRTALLQHPDDSFIDWSAASVQIAAASVQNQADTLNI